jgi:hypothetical protein
MCVWDGTYTAPEEEREAMDQIPGWNDDFASLPVRDWRARPQEPQRTLRQGAPCPKAA